MTDAAAASTLEEIPREVGDLPYLLSIEGECSMGVSQRVAAEETFRLSSPAACEQVIEGLEIKAQNVNAKPALVRVLAAHFRQDLTVEDFAHLLVEWKRQNRVTSKLDKLVALFVPSRFVQEVLEVTRSHPKVSAKEKVLANR